MVHTTSTATGRSAASIHAIGRALDTVGAACVWDANETDITDAITDLLHLAWVSTNDDGEGVAPDLVVENAVAQFEAERDRGDDIAEGGDGRSDREHLEARKAHLVAALDRVQALLDGAAQPSIDPGHRHSPDLCAPALSH